MKDYASLGNVSLLSVEDDSFNQELAIAAFENIPNLKIFRASNGQEAIDIIQKESIDIILLDIMMPKLDGIETLKYLKESEKYSTIPVIMVTSKASEKKTAYHLGADDFLSKPYSPEELKLRVFNYLRLKNFDKLLDDVEEAIGTVDAGSKNHLENIKEALEIAENSQKQLLVKLGTLAHEKSVAYKESAEKIGEYAKLLASIYGLSAKEVNNLYHCMFIYDIGMLKDTTGNMQNSSGKEFKKHPEYGAEIFTDMHETALIRMAKEVTLYHHEHWDGSGYPKGLSSEEIPLYARIATIVDVFDTLTSERFYTQEIANAKEALENMKRDKGTIFDPNLLDMFIENFEKFKEIKNRYE